MKSLRSVIILLCLASHAVAKDFRICTTVFINGQPVKLAFDSGAEKSVLFRKTAKQLNLSIKEAADSAVTPSGHLKHAITKNCKIRFSENGPKKTNQFVVVDIPGFLDSGFDGFLGWDTIKNRMIEIDPSTHRLQVHNTLKFDTSQWNSLDIRTDMNILIIKTSNKDKTQDLLMIDTGDPTGLTLKNEIWQQLVKDTNGSNVTLSARVFPTSLGLLIEKATWTPEIRFGDLALYEVPVRDGFQAYQTLVNNGIDGSLGLYGLLGYQWIIDGPAGKIYFKKTNVKNTPDMYDYNRLGAVFVPENIQSSNELIAHVIENSPAWRAGIRDGDELLRIGHLDATTWRTNSNIMPLSRHWSKPAGTEITLTLSRDGKQTETKVVLEEILNIH